VVPAPKPVPAPEPVPSPVPAGNHALEDWWAALLQQLAAQNARSAHGNGHDNGRGNG
jgi:hypothetical protein